MIDPTDPAYSEIKAELVTTLAAVRAARASLTEARRRRAEAVRRAREFGLTNGDIGHILGVSRQQAHVWGDHRRW